MSVLLALITAGGSAGFGSILKMVGGFIASTQEAKIKREEKETLRELKDNEHALEFQKLLLGNEADSAYVRNTRRVLGIIGMSTLSLLTLWSAVFPELSLTTFSREEGNLSILWGFIDYPVSAKTVEITLGHIAVVAGTVVYPMIVGFYFTPSGRISK